jgi:formimidoylglutamate deiminase
VNRYFAPWALVPEGWRRDVLIDVDGDGTIAAVRTDSASAGATLLSGPAVPGMPNAHSHVVQRALAGRTEGGSERGDSFWTWRERMYAFVRALDPDAFEAIAAATYVEMLCAGYTSVAEFHYLHNAPDGRAYANPAEMSERALAAARSAGIALTLLPVLYRFSDFGGVAPLPEQKRFVLSPDAFAALWESLAQTLRGEPDARLGLAAHSLRAVAPGDPALLVALSNALPGAPLHLHISEQRREVEACVALHGTTPIALLANAIDLGPQWSLVHATHATPSELAQVAAAGAVVVVAPTTEANLGDGIFPARDFARAGGAIAIGSDSHVSLDVAEELRWLEYAQRLAHEARHVLGDGAALYRGTLAAGARSLGRRTGALAAGMRADIVVLDAYAPDETPSLDAYLFRSGTWRVRDVFVGGRIVVRDGRHPRRDELAARAERAVRAAPAS